MTNLDSILVRTIGIIVVLLSIVTFTLVNYNRMLIKEIHQIEATQQETMETLRVEIAREHELLQKLEKEHR